MREQGAQNPVFPYVIGNTPGAPGSFVNGDSDIPSVITGVPQLTTTATQDSPPGVYPIVITQGTLAAPNYYFVFVNGQTSRQLHYYREPVIPYYPGWAKRA